MLRQSWTLLMGVGLLGGCAAEQASQEEPTSKNLYEIAQAYSVIEAGKHRPPNSIEEIIEYLTDFYQSGVGRDPEVVLRSPRDGQPIVIILGASFDSEAKGTIVFYEKEGLDGQRYVMMLSRNVRLVSDEDFAKAAFASGHRPES